MHRMTSRENSSTAVTGLRVLGSARSETTSLPPRTPVSLPVARSSSFDCRVWPLARVAPLQRETANSTAPAQQLRQAFFARLRCKVVFISGSDNYHSCALLQQLSEKLIPQKQGDECERGNIHPPVRRENMVLLQAGQQIPPAWDRFANSQPEE